MRKSRKRYWCEVALCASFFHLIYSPIAYTAEPEEELIALVPGTGATINEKDSYTVNFNNISIIEFIRFASKITGQNFVFDEADLQFSVTVVSEEEIPAKNVMTALSQVLRMHDLMLIQEDGNVLITKSKHVNQIAPIVSADITESDSKNAALVTRVFRVKNANVNTIAGIIRPMCSDSALIEVSVETRQLIVTDVKTNVEQISSLLLTLDTPHSSFEVETYTVKHIPPEDLISLTNQILSPFTEGNPLLFVPQDQTNSIFIVSTPHLIERAITIMEDLDKPAKSLLISKQAMTGRNVFLYHGINRSADDLLAELQQVDKQLKSLGGPKTPVQMAIEDALVIPDTNSLMFVTDPDTIATLKDILTGLDLSTSEAFAKTQKTFFFYKPVYLTAQDIEKALKDLAKDLQGSGLIDPGLFSAIQSVHYVAHTQSLLFTGTSESLDKVQQLLKEIDSASAVGAIQRIGNLNFFLYKIQCASPDKLIASLQSFGQTLDKTNIESKELAEALSNVKFIRESNSLLFTGKPQALEKVEPIVKQLDTTTNCVTPTRTASTFIIYTPRYQSGEALISILCDFMQNLISSGVSDPALFDSINNLKWMPRVNDLIVSGDKESVAKVEQLLTKFDVPTKENVLPSIEAIDNTSFLVYKLQYHPGNDIQLALKEVAASLGKTTPPPTALVDAINSLQWVEVTNSLLVSGQQDVLVKLKDLIQNLDVPLRQVFIEVLLIETTLHNAQQFGLSWGGQAQYMNKATLGTGNFPIAAPNAAPNTTPSGAFSKTLQGINATTTPKGGMVPFSSGFDMGVIGDIIMNKGRSFISLGALVNAIQLDNDSTIVLNPKIIAQDNRQSTIFVGQNVPYTGSLVQNQGQNTLTNTNIEYRDVGVSLTITPMLGENNIVTLDIVHDISQLTSAVPATTTTQVTGIQTSHTHMETRVHVPDNYFVALSGMINDSKVHYKTAIPCLGGLPVIGMFFSENDRYATKDNVIIFIRPKIIDTYGEYKKVTEHQEWLYKDNARMGFLKEEFDEGLDLVKTPENE